MRETHMSRLFRKLVGWMRSPPSSGSTATSPSGEIETPDIGWLFPPATVTDSGAWDRYWKMQLDHGVAGFVHMFCDDGDLVDAMVANELRTVLCVGSGLSFEPRALAAAGFEVTAIDLSPLAVQVVEGTEPPSELLSRLLGGRAFRPGGSLRFVTGDLCDSTLCAGPFDVVVERRTLQLFSETERPTALRAVANRLALRGIFYSHCHDGGWKPPAPRNHATEGWFVQERWALWKGQTAIEGRIAWLFTTTG